MSRAQPGQPNGKHVFPKTQNPIAERLRAGVDGCTRAGLGPVRSERDTASEKGRTPAPFWRGRNGCSVSEKRRGRGTDEGVKGIPSGVDVGDFVCKKFHDIKNDGDAEHPGMREDLKRSGQVNHTETLEKAQRCDGGIEIEARRESRAQSKAKSLDRVHNDD